MADEEKSLAELDKAMFAAEAQDPVDGWMVLLQRSLSDDFRLRRAIGEIEDRERMITRLARSEPVQRVILDEPEVRREREATQGVVQTTVPRRATLSSVTSPHRVTDGQGDDHGRSARHAT